MMVVGRVRDERTDLVDTAPRQFRRVGEHGTHVHVGIESATVAFAGLRRYRSFLKKSRGACEQEGRCAGALFSNYSGHVTLILASRDHAYPDPSRALARILTLGR